MAELTPKTISELPEAATIADVDLFALSHGGASNKLAWSTVKSVINTALGFTGGVLGVASGGTGAPDARTALANLGVTIPNGWTLEFGYDSQLGAFMLDFVVGTTERYRLTWWDTGISYQKYTNSTWSTVWTK